MTTNVTGANNVDAPSRATLLRTTLAAVLVAALLLVTVVLPAEYGIDPLGTGELLGLVVLSDPSAGDAAISVRPDGLIAETESYGVDRRNFQLQPGEYVEYKYDLGEGETMVYSWTADGPVRSEMHSEPWWAAGDAEFFEVLESAEEGHGSYTAPFAGIHGWYWLNETDRPVSVTVQAAGFFSQSTEYVDGEAEPIERPIME